MAPLVCSLRLVPAARRRASRHEPYSLPVRLHHTRLPVTRILGCQSIRAAVLATGDTDRAAVGRASFKPGTSRTRASKHKLPDGRGAPVFHSVTKAI